MDAGTTHSCQIFLHSKEELFVINGLTLQGDRLVIHSKLRKRTIDISHHSHQGIVKTKQLIMEKVWFPGIDKQVEVTVHSCIPWQASNSMHTHREPIRTTPLPAVPWTEIIVNFADPFPSWEYLLVVIDDFSRFPKVEILPSLSANVVIPRLNMISHHCQNRQWPSVSEARFQRLCHPVRF